MEGIREKIRRFIRKPDAKAGMGDARTSNWDERGHAQIDGERASSQFVLTSDVENERHTLEGMGIRPQRFDSMEEALDYVENVSKGAGVTVITPTGRTILKTIA